MYQTSIRDTVLLKQKKLPVLDIDDFFFEGSLSTRAEKETRYKNVYPICVASFVSIVIYLTCTIMMVSFINIKKQL